MVITQILHGKETITNYYMYSVHYY